MIDYRLRWADLGQHAHSALGIAPDLRVLVLNTRDVAVSPETAMVIRQGVEVALGTRHGRALMQDKEQVIALFARIEREQEASRRADLPRLRQG